MLELPRVVGSSPCLQNLGQNKTHSPDKNNTFFSWPQWGPYRVLCGSPTLNTFCCPSDPSCLTPSCLTDKRASKFQIRKTRTRTRFRTKRNKPGVKPTTSMILDGPAIRNANLGDSHESIRRKKMERFARMPQICDSESLGPRNARFTTKGFSLGTLKWFARISDSAIDFVRRCPSRLTMGLLWITQLSPREIFDEIILKCLRRITPWQLFDVTTTKLLLFFGPKERYKIYPTITPNNLARNFVEIHDATNTKII